MTDSEAPTGASNPKPKAKDAEIRELFGEMEKDLLHFRDYRERLEDILGNESGGECPQKEKHPDAKCSPNDCEDYTGKVCPHKDQEHTDPEPNVPPPKELTCPTFQDLDKRTYDDCSKCGLKKGCPNTLPKAPEVQGEELNSCLTFVKLGDNAYNIRRGLVEGEYAHIENWGLGWRLKPLDGIPFSKDNLLHIVQFIEGLEDDGSEREPGPSNERSCDTCSDFCDTPEKRDLMLRICIDHGYADWKAKTPDTLPDKKVCE